jgi:hypothetical protein
MAANFATSLAEQAMNRMLDMSDMSDKEDNTDPDWLTKNIKPREHHGTGVATKPEENAAENGVSTNPPSAKERQDLTIK